MFGQSFALSNNFNENRYLLLGRAWFDKLTTSSARPNLNNSVTRSPKNLVLTEATFENGYNIADDNPQQDKILLQD